MSEITIQPGPALHGLRTIEMENEVLRLVVLPEAGAKVWQIQYKPLAANLLWNNPALVPTRQPLHASYDDTWSGGWDELFPNDEAGELMGYGLPDHGELWTGEWEVERVLGSGPLGLHLSLTTPVSHFLVEKTLILRPECAVVEVRYKLTNRGTEEFPFLFKLHPAFAVSANHLNRLSGHGGPAGAGICRHVAGSASYVCMALCASGRLDPRSAAGSG